MNYCIFVDEWDVVQNAVGPDRPWMSWYENLWKPTLNVRTCSMQGKRNNRTLGRWHHFCQLQRLERLYFQLKLAGRATLARPALQRPSQASQLHCVRQEVNSCWNFRCDLVDNLRIHPAPHSSGASGFRGFRVFDLPPTFSFLRSFYLLDSFNPIYYMPHMTSYSNNSDAVVRSSNW